MVPHQANLRIINAACQRLGIPEEKAVVVIDRYGNTSSASIPSPWSTRSEPAGSADRPPRPAHRVRRRHDLGQRRPALGRMTGDRRPPTLVVLAAGLARRYGGCKPLAPIGPGGEAVIDLLASDAVSAGFGRIVLVLHPETGPAVRYHVEQVWPDCGDRSTRSPSSACRSVRCTPCWPPGSSSGTTRRSPWPTPTTSTASRPWASWPAIW